MSKGRVFSSVILEVNLNRSSTGFLHDGWIEHLLFWCYSWRRPYLDTGHLGKIRRASQWRLGVTEGKRWEQKGTSSRGPLCALSPGREARFEGSTPHYAENGWSPYRDYRSPALVLGFNPLEPRCFWSHPPKFLSTRINENTPWSTMSPYGLFSKM